MSRKKYQRSEEGEKRIILILLGIKGKKDYRFLTIKEKLKKLMNL